MNMHDVTVTIDEGQRQMLLLALAKLSIERPGWHLTLGELAAKYSTAPNIEDGREMFEQFRTIHQPGPPPTADDELRTALDELIKLQAHYATLLNMHDGGQRHAFASADEWIARLLEEVRRQST